MTDLFSAREQEIFSTLSQLKDIDFVLIGGYAVNTYTLPRFSVDCDIVVKDAHALPMIENILVKMGYHKPMEKFSENFARFEKKLEHNLQVSMDILIGKVTDRLSTVEFSADWVFQHAKLRLLRGKTIQKELKLKIIDLDALIVMKIAAGRNIDMRDVFMMLPNAQDKAWIKSEIALRCDFKGRMAAILSKVSSPQFKDGLSGVYGYLDQKVFEKHKKALVSLSAEES